MANLEINNLENNKYYAFNTIKRSNFSILNICLYINTDNT